MKLHLGSGGHAIEGWDNHDMDVDLRKPLPYADAAADFIFTEHAVEHLSQTEAWGFFEECWRVLKPGGVVRITVPSIVKLRETMTGDYVRFVKDNGWGDGTDKSALKQVVFHHGHRSMWSADLLAAALAAVGFRAQESQLHRSRFPELRGVEQHWKTVGRAMSDMESIVVEGTKGEVTVPIPEPEPGLFGKYVIRKRDGTPMDPQAAYFVLRVDGDAYARKAMRVYARAVKAENPELAKDIARWLWNFAPGAACGCREAGCGHLGPEFGENAKLMSDVGARLC